MFQAITQAPLLLGLDAVGSTLQCSEAIKAFERGHLQPTRGLTDPRPNKCGRSRSISDLALSRSKLEPLWRAGLLWQALMPFS